MRSSCGALLVGVGVGGRISIVHTSAGNDARQKRKKNMNNVIGQDSTGTWTPAAYAIDAGWDYTCIEATAAKGVSEEDADGLTDAQQSELLDFCRSRVADAAETAYDAVDMTTNELLVSSLRPNLTTADYGRIASELIAAGYYYKPGMKFYKTGLKGDIQVAITAMGMPAVQGVMGEITTTIVRIECAAGALKKALNKYVA